MCNFYIMYYVEGNRIMRDSYCFSAGPPQYYWYRSPFADEMNLKHIPKTASVIPGTDKVIKVRHWFYGFINLTKIPADNLLFKTLEQMSHLMTKPTKWLCAQRRLRSAWASAWILSYWLSAQRRLWSDWADLSLHLAQRHFVDFVMRRLILWSKRFPKIPQNCAIEILMNTNIHLGNHKIVKHYISWKSISFSIWYVNFAGISPPSFLGFMTKWINVCSA